MKWQHLALVLLLATAAVLPSARGDEAEVDDDEEDLDEERAILVIRRTLADERPLEGKQTIVTIQLHNAGNIDAKNVKVADAAWPANFEVAGELTASFDTIPEGSTVSHTYKVTGKEAGVYSHPAPKVTYQAGPEADDTQTATGEALHFRTWTFGESIVMKLLEAGARLTGGALTSVDDWKRAGIFTAVVVAALATYRSYASVAESQKNRRRAKALAELAALEKEK